MQCRLLPDDPDVVEIAAKGHCERCGRVGYFNYSRIRKPADFASCIGSIFHLPEDNLEPRLLHDYRPGHYCSACIDQ